MKALLATTLLTLVLVLTPNHARAADDDPLETRSATDLRVIKTQKGFSTLIEFPADQKIREVTCGDKDSWVIEGSGRFLHVKPGKEGVLTNIHILMDDDKTVYSFVLREITGPRGVKGKADLEVVVNPDHTVAELTSRLDAADHKLVSCVASFEASNKQNEQLLQKLNQTETALNDVTEKYRALTANAKPAATPAPSLRPTEVSTMQGPDGRYYLEQKYWTGSSWVVVRTETRGPSGQGNAR